MVKGLYGFEMSAQCSTSSITKNLLTLYTHTVQYIHTYIIKEGKVEHHPLCTYEQLENNREKVMSAYGKHKFLHSYIHTQTKVYIHAYSTYIQYIHTVHQKSKRKK